MKRLFSAAILALCIHWALFNLDAGLIGRKTVTMSKARIVTVTMSYRQKKNPPAPIPKMKKTKPRKKIVKPERVQKKIEKPKEIIQEPEKPKVAEEEISADDVPEEKTDEIDEPVDTDLSNQSIDSADHQGVQETAPRYRYKPEPAYPRKAKRRGYTGTVVLMVLVDTNGMVKNLWVFESSGYRILDNAAINSVRNWMFYPLTRGGKPVEKWINQPVTFELE